jgi:hypothetical protein
VAIFSATHVILSQMAGGNALPAIIFAQYEKNALHIIMAFL